MTLEEYHKKIDKVVENGKKEMEAATTAAKADLLKAVSEKEMTHEEFTALSKSNGIKLKRNINKIKINWQKEVMKIQRQYFKELGKNLLHGEIDKIC